VTEDEVAEVEVGECREEGMELDIEMESAAAFLNREVIIACGPGKKIKKYRPACPPCTGEKINILTARFVSCTKASIPERNGSLLVNLLDSGS
jgi:hypothetical protein